MSNQIYNYSSSYGGGGGTSSFYSLRATNPYLSDGGSSRLSSVDSLAAADTGMYSDRMSSLYSKSGDGSLRLSGSDIALLFDGGIRTGADLLRALALGARACMVGRAFVFGLGAGGEAGVRRAIDILGKELDVKSSLPERSEGVGGS